MSDDEGESNGDCLICAVNISSAALLIIAERNILGGYHKNRITDCFIKHIICIC